MASLPASKHENVVLDALSTQAEVFVKKESTYNKIQGLLNFVLIEE